MPAARLLAVAMLAVALSGCASRGTKDRFARLSSQVGLLDERVTQLERMGAGSTASTFTTEAPATQTWPSADDAQTGAKRKSSSAIAVHAAKKHAKAPSSGNPTTKDVQQALKAAGFYQGNVDGKSGPLTRQAVEEFQRINGLKADGVVGHQTWSKLQQYAELSGDATVASK